MRREIMVKRSVSGVFPSIIQPLRQAILVRNGLSAKDLDFDKKKIWVIPKVTFPEKSAPQKSEWLCMKYQELEKLEKNNLEILAGISMILSQTGFQKLFNPVEIDIIKKSVLFMNGFVKIRTRLMRNKAYENESATTLDKIEYFYTAEYLKIQKQMVIFFPDMFALMQVFKNKHMAKKMASYFDMETRSMGKRESRSGMINDPREFILSGDILSLSVQCINRRALLLREIIAQTIEGSQDELRLKNIYENAEAVNLFAQEIMKETDRIAIEINNDPFCLRQILCDEEAYGIMISIVKKKDKKRYQALSFLRDLSLLIKDGCFLTDGFENKGKVLAFSLRHASSRSREVRRCIQSGNHVALIEALIVKTEKNLKLVETVLTQFSTSKYFVERAGLAKTENETDEKYQHRLKQKILHGGECVELFSIAKEQNKKWKHIRPNSKAPSKEQASFKNPQRKKGLLDVIGLMAPFIVFAAVPIIGLPFCLLAFSILGLASLAYYMAPEKKEDKQDQTVKDFPKQENNMNKNKAMELEDLTSTPGLKNHLGSSIENPEIMGRRRQSSIVIGERNSLNNSKRQSYSGQKNSKKSVQSNPKKEINWTYGAEVVEEISFLHRMESSAEAKTVLGGSMWLVEDRKRRKKVTNKDEIKMDNPISSSDVESSNASGYESFPDLEDELDSNGPVDFNHHQYRHGL